MKTRNLRNLQLNKKRITNLNETTLKGGRPAHDWTHLTYCASCDCKKR